MLHDKKKTIMFYSGGWTVGGIEKVTVLLANEMIARGWNVVVAFSVLQEERLLTELRKEVKVVCITSGKMLRTCVLQNDVKIILNASVRTLFFKFWTLGLKVRLYRYIHNKPNVNGRIMASVGLRRMFWVLCTKIALWGDWLLSEGVLLLSRRFEKALTDFLHVTTLSRLYVVTNPVSMKMIEIPKKENVILYVGRLEENQKKVSRIFKIWETLCTMLPNYTLEIVGDGSMRSYYEHLTENLPRVIFHGYRDPTRDYARAKCILMTSDFEGFGLVLVEAMAYGCIPIVLNTFEALEDIVEDNVTGFCLKPPFEVNSFVCKIKMLVNNEGLRYQLACNAVESSKRFTTASAVNQLEDILGN